MTDESRMQAVTERAKAAADAAKRFNARPPVWFYWVAGLVIVAGFQLVRAL